MTKKRSSWSSPRSLVTALVIGPLVSILAPGDYFSAQQTWGYIVNNAGLYTLQHQLPGVFVDNPWPWSVNGSIWTLPMEMLGYALVLVVGVIVLIGVPRLVLFLVLGGLWAAEGEEVVGGLRRLGRGREDEPGVVPHRLEPSGPGRRRG